jgi:hypothetical protein
MKDYTSTHNKNEHQVKLIQTQTLKIEFLEWRGAPAK